MHAAEHILQVYARMIFTLEGGRVERTDVVSLSLHSYGISPQKLNNTSAQLKRVGRQAIGGGQRTEEEDGDGDSGVSAEAKGMVGLLWFCMSNIFVLRWLPTKPANDSIQQFC